MANSFENYYIKSLNKHGERNNKYIEQLNYIKQLIREYVHENAALVDELEEMQKDIIIRSEERKYLLKKLCEYEPQVVAEVQNAAKSNINQSTLIDNKNKKRLNDLDKKNKSKRLSVKQRKKIIQAIPVDGNNKPIYPINLGHLKIHCLGEIIHDRIDFHNEDVFYPVGYLATRIYGSLKDPTKKCLYTCKVTEENRSPKFEIKSDDNSNITISGDTPDICHSLLLQHINDTLSLNVVSIRPRGHEFFGLNHPVVLNLLQTLHNSKKCTNYKWNKFEISRSGGYYTDDNDAGLNFEYLQRSINFCKFKMTSNITDKPPREEFF